MRSVLSCSVTSCVCAPRISKGPGVELSIKETERKKVSSVCSIGEGSIVCRIDQKFVEGRI